MYTTVVEHEGKLVYGALSKKGELLCIFSSKVMEYDICEDCEVRRYCCRLDTGEKVERLCRICLDKKTGAI